MAAGVGCVGAGGGRPAAHIVIEHLAVDEAARLPIEWPADLCELDSVGVAVDRRIVADRHKLLQLVEHVKVANFAALWLPRHNPGVLAAKGGNVAIVGVGALVAERRVGFGKRLAAPVPVARATLGGLKAVARAAQLSHAREEQPAFRRAGDSEESQEHHESSLS